MGNNFVHIEGTVKRSAAANDPRPNVRVMGFCLAVPDPMNDGLEVYVDCFAATDAVNMLDGFVTEGERLAVNASLTFRTMTDHRGRRKSTLMVYVNDVEEIEK